MTPPGAQFEISVDGKPRSYHDTKDVAIESAEFLKAKNRTARSRSKTCEAAKSPRWHSGRSEREAAKMTTLSMRYKRDDFIVTGPDIEPVK
jgi:hypothetical protein